MAVAANGAGESIDVHLRREDTRAERGSGKRKEEPVLRWFGYFGLCAESKRVGAAADGGRSNRTMHRGRRGKEAGGGDAHRNTN